MTPADHEPAAEAERLLGDATLAFALGSGDEARVLLHRALELAPGVAAAWHALAEVELAARRLDAAAEAGARAEALAPDDVHLQTSLSRIWMERGDKERAEAHGARARMLSWKEELRNPPAAGSPAPGR